ncbi:DUF3916 domain-containing protein [Neobacillus notoginsengisoli]|uniref:DUF3916 domain-containing protein n=2 Tax=Neobacillus notoginsengisoli TaxID=1578198 RepID=A0A417YQ25_9BACI|nr:DUF3916 domain-containing protein [Neobacillus notoginsengisoli]
MIDQIIHLTEEFPTEFYNNNHWCLHLPVSQAFINSSKLPLGIKRLCVQTLIDRTIHLIEKKPHSNDFLRVIAAIQLPSLWNSQIIIFKGESYYKEFFQRDNKYYNWTPLSNNRNLIRELGVDIPKDIKIRGVKEIIDDEDGYFENEIWFIGELEEGIISQKENS